MRKGESVVLARMLDELGSRVLSELIPENVVGLCETVISRRYREGLVERFADTAVRVESGEWYWVIGADNPDKYPTPPLLCEPLQEQSDCLLWVPLHRVVEVEE